MSKDGKVVDLFTRTRLDTSGEELQAQEPMVSTVGKFLGRLPKQDAAYMREWNVTMQVKHDQLMALYKAYSQLTESYMQNLALTLHAVGTDPASVNPEVDAVFVGEEGDVWCVPYAEMEEFKKLRTEATDRVQ